VTRVRLNVMPTKEASGLLSGRTAVRPYHGGPDPSPSLGVTREGYEQGSVTLGALVTLAEIERSPVILTHAPVLVETVRYMATPQVRTLATLGGNLCQAAPAADLAVTLLTLNASVTLVGPSGPRRVTLDHLLAPWGGTTLAPGEILTDIHVPVTQVNATYRRFSVREAVDVPLANVAVALAISEGRITKAGIALGASGHRPTRATRAEQALVGQIPTPAFLVEIADLAVADYYPADDHRASRWYRREVARVLMQRALLSLV
jgi:aerobic carbon-monoxide dehydrogenase medium subunit